MCIRPLDVEIVTKISIYKCILSVVFCSYFRKGRCEIRLECLVYCAISLSVVMWFKFSEFFCWTNFKIVECILCDLNRKVVNCLMPE